MISIDTETERTLFFDFLPLDLGTVHGFQTRFHLYTVPGQVLYERTRVAVLTGVDGVVFVADSQPNKMRDNIESLKEFARNIQNEGKKFKDFPLVLQYNKRDMPNAVPLEQMNYYLNSQLNARTFEAVASRGVGVFDTLKYISKLVISKL